MINDPIMKKSILASIIASILVVVFIQPILNLVFKVTNITGEYVYVGFSNGIYRNAALGERSNLVFMIYCFMLALVTIFCGAVVFVSVNRVRKLISPREATGKKEDTGRIQVDTPNTSKRSTYLQGLSITMVILYILLLLCVLGLLTLAYTNLQLYTSFRQRLTVLAPKITEQEYKELQASWASMRSRTDYEAVTEEMNRLAQEHNIVLPELLMK
jgi:hypothetical protein